VRDSIGDNSLAKKTLGKYEIIERLGRGGMAEVYKAYHASLDRYVAIKLLHPFLADDKEFKDRFEREAQNIAKLRHPHIVQVFDFDFDESGESYYMVMELIEGQTLKDVLGDITATGERIPLERAIEITRQSAQALSYAHKRGMIHRDVKPANLMIEESDQRVVLTDFGIAKIVTGAHFTASGGMIGTPAYMSPEQGMGESGDERSDIYSLGVIMYQMLAGRLPFDAETPLAIILKHLNEALPPLLSINPEVPPWLAAIVEQALAKDPGERFYSADELVAALDEGQGIVSEAAATLPKRPDRPVEETTPLAMITSRIFNTGGDKRGTQTTRAVTPRYGTKPLPEPSRFNWLTILTPLFVGLGVLTMIAIVLGQGGSGPLAGVFATEVAQVSASDTPSPTATFTSTPSPTATFTDTPSPTATFTNTPSPTATFTNTPSPTATFTNTPSPTATFTNTPSPTLSPTVTFTPTVDLTMTVEAGFTATATAATATAQAQADFFATQRAVTPTLDIQRSLETCDLEFTIVSPEGISDPPSTSNTRNPRLVASGADWELQIVLQNTSTCDWPEGLIFLSFVDNAEADISPFDDGCVAGRSFTDHNLTNPSLNNLRIDRAVPQGEQVSLTLEARAGDRFGCYFGVWELRIPSYGLFIGEPFIIGYRAFGGS
jgi:serine/threonine-protein kinase